MLEALIAAVTGALAIVAKETLSILQESLRQQKSIWRAVGDVYREALAAVVESQVIVIRSLARSFAPIPAVLFTAAELAGVAAGWIVSGVWLRAVSKRYLVASVLIVGGTISLLMSRFGWWWVGGDTWWQDFHLNVGVILVGVGLIDQLVVPSAIGADGDAPPAAGPEM